MGKDFYATIPAEVIAKAEENQDFKIVLHFEAKS